jgi:hypothetical protein
MLLNFIPNRGDPHLSIDPYIYDPEGRFGLGLLFQCYNRIAVLIALGSSFLVLVGMNGIQSQNRHHGFNLSLLNIVGILVVLIALGLLIFGPPLFTGTTLKKRQFSELNKLYEKLNTPGGIPEDEIEKIYEKIRLVRTQKTWPRTDSTFLAALAFCFLMLLAPFPIFSQFLGETGERWVTLAHAAQTTFHDLISPE